MKAFTALFTAIEQTTKTNAKIEALVQYFATAPAPDVLWCIAILTGKTPKRTVKTAELKAWAAEQAGLPFWLFEESYHIVGDLAETITLCLPEPLATSNYSLTDTIQFLHNLAALSEADKKQQVTGRWSELQATERFVFNKLITGNFRMGVSRQLVIKALARFYDREENEIAHRLMGQWQPQETTLPALLSGAGTTDRSYQPYPFFLAYQLDMEPEMLGNIADWQVEDKFDGIRGQIIVRDGQLFVWSRGEELLTDKFPEFAPLAGLLPDGTVLDGEIIPWRDGQPLPFALMQTRISRKAITRKALQDAPLVMVCYDLLEEHGTDIRNKPLRERRHALAALLQQLPEPVPLILSPELFCTGWEEVRQARLGSRSRNCEGLMLKRKDSVYETGRRRGNWWKWKVDPFTIDGVLIYAQQGHGRRANLLTDYTFAVWDGDVLVPFTKAYSGLTDKELLEVDNWIKRHTLEKFGPVRSVQPVLVFELAFEGINLSSRHKSGVALRFPRITRWRRDKPASEANTKQDLLDLIAMGNL
ncbi:ATP-dependent DNA ligase [Taibaiella chishuiensis]|uniref:DNA ligase (ATP) n=1 Tax=Taibaiella chishuiensis TaxID=1434707 RepID=A0A2P8D190_9BACT|nr:ATP-dependent DNA ligase [Taibaiella chishuiensis]PSK91000.1 DNA ligase-1 [Taibaiella chishuiensis]